MILPLKGFLGPSYRDKTLNEVQRCVNWHPVKTDQGWKLVTDPGLVLAYTIPGDLPSRGWHKASNGNVYSAHGNKLYQLSSVAATELGTLASSSGAVYFADDGDTLLISAPTTSYTMPMAVPVLTAIVDANFIGGGNPVASLDGYFICTDGAQFALSALGDPADWTPATADAPDPRGGNIHLLFATSDRLLIFQFKGIEQWYNTGSTPFIFERISGSTLNLGIPDRLSFAFRGQTLYFQAVGDGADTALYELGGKGLRKISTPYIDGLALSALSAFCYELDGRAVYQVNASLTSFVYDIEGEYWWEKSSNIGGSYVRNRCLAIINRASGTSPLALDSENGNAYLVSAGANSEAGTAFRRIKDFGPIKSGTARIFHKWIRFVFEVDHDSSATYTFEASLEWSDDAGRSWSTSITLSQAVTSGTTGQRIELRAYRLGQAVERIYRLALTGPAAKIILSEAELMLEEGNR